MRLIALLALFHLGSPSTALAGGKDGQAFETWSRSAYTYCDALILAQHWGGDAYDAKLKIGKRMMKGDGESIMDALNTARTAALRANSHCPYAYTTFTYGDAQRLAEYWNISTIDAKTRVEEKVTRGGEPLVQSVLDAIGRLEPHTPAPATHTDSCQTKMLRHLWGMSTEQVHAYVEQKISNGYPGYIEQELGEARTLAAKSTRVACAFYDTPYTLQDADALAERWGKTRSEAKAHVELKYVNGLESWLAAEVAASRSAH